MQTIEDFNKSILYDGKYDLITYVKHINSLSIEPIDLSFMEKFLEYVDLNTCCIPHTLLVDYGVFKEKNASNHIKETLELYEFKEGEDFLLPNVREFNGGRGNKNIYYLKPDTFKFILMRSKCEKKYAKYYLLLEKSIKYYHDYQIIYKDYIISQKDDKIDALIAETREIKQLNLELLSQNKDIKEDLSTLIDFSVDQAEQNELSESKIKTVIVDRINKPDNKNSIEQLLLFTYKDSYYVVRGTLTYIKTKYRSLTNVTYPKESQTDYVLLKHFKDVPNARHLFRVLKERYNVINNGNTFKTHLDAIHIIQDIIDNRYTILIEEKELANARTKASKKVLKVLNK